MQQRPLIWIGLLVGSTIGGMIPSLWGADMFSMSALLCSSAGAFAGILLGARYS